MSGKTVNHEEHSEFEKKWLEELKPEGVIEGEYARSFIHATWLKRRVTEAQDQLLGSTSTGTIAALPEADARSFERLHKLEEGYSKRAARSLRELMRLQAERRGGGAPRGGGPKRLRRPQPQQQQDGELHHLIPDGPSKLIH